MNEHDDQYWHRQGCALILGLSILSWVLITSFGVWVYRYGIAVD